jgi:hypothetical protein
MTRKDFELIAQGIAEGRAACAYSDDIESQCYAIDNLAKRVAEKIATTNPAFDRRRFLTACGVPA